jgi:hypothetical protein
VSSISGPTSTPSSVPRPTRSLPIRSASFVVKSSAIEPATWKRLAAVQASPTFRILAIIAPSIAASRSASSKTRNGALPPSSIDTLSTLSAAWAISVRPTSVEPVNESLRRRGSAMIGFATELDDELVMMLRTPPGRPASSSSCARANAESGVCCGGFQTMVHPAAIAGPSLRVPIAIGKFQGVMKNEGPTGWRMTRTRLPPLPATL